MQEFICKNCNRLWYVKKEFEDDVKTCPFCALEVTNDKAPPEIIVDSFENAIYKIITDKTTSILTERNKFFAYLRDIAPEYRKETNIASKSCDDKFLNTLYVSATQCHSELTITIAKLKNNLINDEGMSDSWANLICDSFLGAIQKSLGIVCDTTNINSATIVTDNYEGLQNNYCNPTDFTITEVTDLASCGVNFKDSIFYNKYKKATSKRIRFTELVIGGEWEVIPEEAFAQRKVSWLILNSNVKKIGRKAFFDCGLQLVFVPSSVEEIEDFAFAKNSGITVVFEESDRIISPCAFDDCSSIKVACSSKDYYVRDYFKQNNLVTVGIGPYEQDFIKYAKHKCKEFSQDCLYPILGQIKSELFEKNSGKLYALKLSRCDMKNAFCINNTYTGSSKPSIVITSDTFEIRPEAFMSCTNLKYVYLEGGYIGKKAFANCDMLKYVVLGDKVNYIDESAFEESFNLDSIVCLSEDKIVRDYCKQQNIRCRLYDTTIFGRLPQDLNDFISYAKDVIANELT